MSRIRIVGIFVIIMFLFLALAVFNLACVNGRKYKELSSKNCIRLLSQPGARGKILDQQGNIIVDNRLSYDVLILSRNSASAVKTLDEVSRILGRNPDELKIAFKKSFVGYSVPTPVARNIDLKQVQRIQTHFYQCIWARRICSITSIPGLPGFPPNSRIR